MATLPFGSGVWFLLLLFFVVLCFVLPFVGLACAVQASIRHSAYGKALAGLNADLNIMWLVSLVFIVLVSFGVMCHNKTESFSQYMS